MRDEPLSQWIAQATAGLPPSAAGPFRAEIADHAAEAEQRHIDAGMPPMDAERAALADLGDASAVGRALRDAHFSRREYARGLAAALVGLGLLLGWAIFRELVLPRRVWGPALAPALPYADFAYQLLEGLALLAVARAALIILDEAFDVRFTRPVRLALLGLVALNFVPAVFYQLLEFAARAWPRLGAQVSPQLWNSVLMVSLWSAVAGCVFGGGLAAVVFARKLDGTAGMLRLMLALAALTGAALAITMSAVGLTLIPGADQVVLPGGAAAQMVGRALTGLYNLGELGAAALLAVLARQFARVNALLR